MKKPIKILALFAALACLAFALPAKNESKRKLTVVIDAAHGGKDFGSVYQGFTEKDIARNVAEKVMAMNHDTDVTIYFTRSNDDFVELKDRVKTINQINPDIVLSLHVNQIKNENTAGAEFYITDQSASASMANKYAQELESTFVKSGLSKSRGIKTAPFWILKQSAVPAITFEMGFLSNTADRQYLTTAEGQERMAAVITDFISKLK